MSGTIIKERVIAIDIKRDITSYAVVTQRDKILAEDHFLTTDYPDINAFVGEISRRIIQMAEETGGVQLIRSIGVNAPNSNSVTGYLENPVNMPWTGSIPLAIMLRENTGLAVQLANSSITAALGEKTYGDARGVKDFVTMTLGSGVGSCTFTNGNYLQGAFGFAGEIGHNCIIPDGRECFCGRKGCLEAYTSTSGIIRTARELLGQDNRPSLMRNIPELTPYAIKECCDQGDELALEVYRLTGKWLGIGLANYASLVNPELIILTGGTTRAGDYLLQPLRESFEAHVFRSLVGKVRIQMSRLNDVERGLIATSQIAWEVKEYSLFL